MKSVSIDTGTDRMSRFGTPILDGPREGASLPSPGGSFSRSVTDRGPMRAEQAGLTTRMLCTAQDLHSIAPAWLALEARSAGASFFQSHAWSTFVLSTLRQHGSGDVRPRVLAVWRKHELVAVWPLQLIREGAVEVLTDLTAPFAQYSGIVLARELLDGEGRDDQPNAVAPSTEELCRWLLVEARRLSRADALVLRKVRLDTPLASALGLEQATALGARQRAPFVNMGGYPSFDAFHASTKAKTRKNVRNATHRLEKLGQLTHRVERRSPTMHDAIRRCFDLRSDWLDEKGMISTAFAHAAFPALIEGLARPESHAVDVLSMMLMLDDEPISIHYGFVHNRRYYAYMAARNPKYDACSPGKVHLEHVMRACFDEGVEIVDLLAPEMPYKMVWTQEAVETRDYGMTWSWRGRIAIDLWRRRLRPMALKAFGAMPTRARRTLSRSLRSRRVDGGGRCELG